MAQASVALPLTADVLPAGWEMIPLPGHSFNMVGFKTQDNVVYLADCLSGQQTLEKYKICFLSDVEKYLETLERVKTMEAVCFVPSHADAEEEIATLAQKNIACVYAVADELLSVCREPVGFDRILKAVFDDYALTMTAQQHALVGSTLRSYLTWLCETGKLQTRIEDNIMRWARI